MFMMRGHLKSLQPPEPPEGPSVKCHENEHHEIDMLAIEYHNYYSLKRKKNPSLKREIK